MTLVKPAPIAPGAANKPSGSAGQSDAHAPVNTVSNGRLPEIYTSLDTGVLDGLGHTPAIMVDQNFYEVTDYVTLDHSMGVANFYIINEEFYQSLPDDLQGVIRTGAEMGADVEFGIATHRNRVESIATLEDEGMEIHELSDEERERVREATHERVIPWLKERAGEDTVQAVFEEVERIENQ